MFVRRLLHEASTRAEPLRFAPYTYRQRHQRNPSLPAQCRLLSSFQPSQSGIRILYASQTGTAQLFAHQLAECLEDEGLENVSVQGLEERPPHETFTPGDLHLLLTSCTGKGEPPDNSRKFYEWLMNHPSAELSSDVNFAVFGLGNESAHPNNYNIIGKRIDARLDELGGTRVNELGLGDDGGCIEEDFDLWMDKISMLIAESSSESDGSTLSEGEEDSQLSLESPEVVDKSNDETILTSSKHPTLALEPPRNNVIRRDLFHLTGSNRFYAEKTAKLKVNGNHLLTSDAGESALREMRVSLERDYANDDSIELSYTTGDHILVYPMNSEAIVKAYIDMLGVDPDAIISENNDEAYPYPTGITVAETLSHCVDLGALPSPSFSRKILGRKELDYVKEIAEPRRTVIDLCHEVGTKLSLELFLYHATPMKPRYYSIASSSTTSPDEISLVFRPVHYMTSKGYLREGVCTMYMCYKTMQKGLHESCVPAIISPNPGFRLPEDPRTPVMFIGGGCGVAPIRAFIEERMALAKSNNMGPAALFMGYRNPQDEVYTDLVQEALDMGALTESDIAYSSGCDLCEAPAHQMPVSDMVRLKGEHVWKHIRDGGHIYLCGGARTFGLAMESALLEIIQEHGSMDVEHALEYLRGLTEEGRLAEDLAN